MKPLAEHWSIVVAGAWNPAIFTPSWVVGRLTSAQEVVLEFPVDEPSQPPRLSFDSIFLTLGERRLVLAPSAPDDELLQRTQDVACKILAELHHTPVSAVGVNFSFLEDQPEGILARLFELGDSGALSDEGFRLSSTSIRRSMIRDDHLLNLTLSFLEDSAVRVDFNFHRDVDGAIPAREALSVGVLRFKSLAFEVLERIYNATPE